MRFRVGAYLWILNSAMITMLMIIALFSIFHLIKIHIELKEIAYKDIPITELVTGVMGAQLEQAIRLERVQRLSALPEPKARQESLDRAIEEFHQYGNDVDRRIKRVRSFIDEVLEDPTGQPRTQANFQAVHIYLERIEKEYEDYESKALCLLIPNPLLSAEEHEDIVEELEKEGDELEKVVEELIGMIERFAFQSAEQATLDEYKALKGTTLLSFLGAILAFLLGFRIYRAIVPALKRAIDFAGVVAAGDRSTHLKAGQEDTVETARLLDALDEMLQAVLRTEEELKESREALRVQATYDALTGLWNRRVLLENLSKELARATREEGALSIAIVDLDHFKAVNDRHGHLVGDLVLSEAARRMAETVREYDGVGRYGGEEFMIVMPGADKDAAHEVAERVRKALADTPVEDEKIRLEISASLGVTSSKGNESIEDITARADEALYRAKEAGRNMTCFGA